MRFTRTATVFGAVGLLLAGGAIAYAAIPGPDGVISACYAKADAPKKNPTPAYSKGDVRLVQPGESCRSYETAINWNQQGPKGDPGDAAQGQVQQVRAASRPDAGEETLFQTSDMLILGECDHVGAWITVRSTNYVDVVFRTGNEVRGNFLSNGDEMGSVVAFFYDMVNGQVQGPDTSLTFDIAVRFENLDTCTFDGTISQGVVASP